MTLTEAQRDARKQLLAWLDAGAPETPEGAHFDMNYVYSDTGSGCGTACCMAGYLLETHYNKNTAHYYSMGDMDTAFRIAGALVGLPVGVAYRLFLPEGIEGMQPYDAADLARRTFATYGGA